MGEAGRKVLICWSGHYIGRALKVLETIKPSTVFVLLECFSKEWYELSRALAEHLRDRAQDILGRGVGWAFEPEEFKPIESGDKPFYFHIGKKLKEIVDEARKIPGSDIYIDITNASAHGGLIAERIGSWFTKEGSVIYIVDCLRGDELRDVRFYMPSMFTSELKFKPRETSLSEYRDLELEDEGGEVVIYRPPPHTPSIMTNEFHMKLLELMPGPNEKHIRSDRLRDRYCEKYKEDVDTTKVTDHCKEMASEGFVEYITRGRYHFRRTRIGDLILHIVKDP